MKASNFLPPKVKIRVKTTAKRSFLGPIVRIVYKSSDPFVLPSGATGGHKLSWLMARAGRFFTALHFIAIFACLSVQVFALENEAFATPVAIKTLLDAHCCSCHDGDTMKGKVRLDDLDQLALQSRLDLFNRVQEQVFSGEMPPKNKLKPAETDALLRWVGGELALHKASKLEDKLRFYKYGNYVNHERLFSGEIKDAPFTPARRWRVNEMIYIERVNDVLELRGNKRQTSFYGVVKPFNLPSDSGVKYYDTEIVEGGQFLTLLANAKWIVSKQLRSALLKSGDFKYSDAYLEMAKSSDRETQKKLGREFPDESWQLGRTAVEFENVVMSKGTPSESVLQAAITRQFDLALQRPPDAAEMTRYVQFMNENMSVGGKAKALEKMMVSVLMEPDFLYRSEFGDEKLDEFGRTKLTPREASYAIAYALTDEVPDDALARAAKAGKLSSKEDYAREVTRILLDDKIEKPRLLRFFQDYFGYYNIYNVFKDEERFGGAYNPHRVVAAKYIWRIPGKVSKEADTLVSSILKSDKDVLHQLLTTDKFFVQHNGNNAEMAEKAKKAIEIEKTERDVFLALKNTKKEEDFIEVGKKFNYFTDKNGKPNTTPIHNRMQGFRLLFGEDGKIGADRHPAPNDGEATNHSVKMYNLDYFTWNYEPVQPIKIENRMGMLTHPAWLVSFSQNAHTDPVRRGKWIREKLLGGIIQDVPITVDAKVPEDPHRTLRERFTVTENKDCWSCHRRMNPLGNTFECYDDFGRFRKEEEIEYPENVIGKKKEVAPDHNGVIKKHETLTYKSKPVDSRGALDGTGDKSLDGDVADARDLIARLAKSDRVRQTFVRNVFRYFMGRNEMLSDSKTLIDADTAYVQSGGSFKALVTSLLTSDSFMYRKAKKEKD